MDRVIFNVLSCKPIQPQYLYQQRIFVSIEIVIEVLCLFSTNRAFFSLYSLEDKLVVECSKEKLATFATFCIGLFLHLRKVASNIKRTKEIEPFLPKHPAIVFRRIDTDLEAQCLESG